MQRFLVLLLSLSVTLASAQPPPNINAKRAPGWKGQNFDGDTHDDLNGSKVRTRVNKSKPRTWQGEALDFNNDSHGDRHGPPKGKRERGPVTVPLIRRSSAHQSPTRGGLLSAKEIKENTAFTDVIGLQAARDALIDKFVDGETSKRRLRERRKKRDALDAEEFMWKGRKSKRVVKDVAMTNHNFDTVYSANLLLGTPPQPFAVLLDTGSSDTWVTAANCSCTSQGCTSCATGSSWDPSTSSTYSRQDKILRIAYGSGIVNGWTATDVASLGGFSIADQVVGVVDDVTRVLPGVSEGLMGLAFGYIARAGGTPWWLRVLAGESSESLDGGVMSFWLSRYIGTTDISQNDHPGGQFTFGGTNASLYTGDITYSPVIQPAKWWLIPLSSIGIEGRSTVEIAASVSYSIIDTGTTLIGGQDTVIEALFSSIEGAVKGQTIASKMRGFYAIPCDSNAIVTFTFSGVTFPMSSRDLLYMRIDDLRPNYCLASLFVFSSADPHSFDFRDPGTPYWLIGDAFLKNVYSVYDLGESWRGGDGSTAGPKGMGNLGTTARVGFAKLSGVDGEVGMAVGVDGYTTSISRNSTSTAVATALPVGILPDVMTTVVYVTATEDGPSASSTSGAGRTVGRVVAGALGGFIAVALAALW